ncbi:MAG: tRNA uracil 4-sulfurtransferase ThiI, partial [Oscillospiraceae bacterium]
MKIEEAIKLRDQGVKEIILIKNGEIALKGGNRSTFEELLCKNIRHRLKKLGIYKVWRSQSTITVTPEDESYDLDKACDAISKIFGIAQFSRAAVCQKDFNDIKETTIVYLKDILENVKTFKVESKRSDKTFLMKSPEISSELGGFILDNFPHLTVDVHNPDVVVTIEVRQISAYIHHKKIQGAGGMPVSSGGKAGILISGGIDSPVAAYMMSKRGLELTAIHFFSPPYTSERAKQKVVKLLEKLSLYCGKIKTIIVPFTEIQEQIREQCDEEYFTLIMRRFMMKISQIIAQNNNCDALITGESLGQVASQTIMALACTDNVCTMPVF